MDSNSNDPPLAKPLSLRRNLAHAAVGKVVYTLTQFGILAVVAHLGPPEDVGAMTLASAIVTPLFFLTSMGMRDVHAVDDLDTFTRADYVALRLFGGVVAILLAGVLALTYQASSGWVVQATTISFAFVKFFGAQSSVNHGMFQREERMDFVSASILVRGISGFAIFTLVYWYFRSLPLALACEALAWLATNVFDQRLLARLGAQTFFTELSGVRPRKVVKLLWWVLPVGVSLWLTRAGMSAPPLVLEHHADLATVGVFGAMIYLHTALSMMSGVLGSASASRMRKLYRAGEQKAFARLAMRMTLGSAALGAVGVFIAWLIGEPFLGIAFGPEYRRGDLFVVVMLASAISITGGPLLTAISAGQAFRQRMTVSLAVAGVAVIASLLLVPPYGAIGAAWALVATTTANLLLTMLSFRLVSARIPAPMTDASASMTASDGVI